MKCPSCNGTGLVYNALGDFEEDCGYCHGTGNVVEPQTNEEWFCGLSTEEKAKALNDIFWKHLNFVGEHELVDDDITEIYLQWLKEKHE